MTHRALFWTLLLLFGLTPALAAQDAEQKAQLQDFFEKKIRPVLVENCTKCPGAKKQSGEPRFDRRESMLKGNDDGPIVVQGQPDKSRLLRALRHEGEQKMPPDKKLPEPERTRLAEEYATVAVERLRQAVAAGYFNTPDRLADLRGVNAIQPLRQRPDYQKLVQEAEAAAKKEKARPAVSTGP